MDSDRISPGFSERRIERWVGAHGEPRVDCVAEEVPVAMHYNGRSFAVMMATPQDLEDFAIGFSLSEGLVDSIDQVFVIDVHRRLEGIELALTVAPEAQGWIGPAGAICSIRSRRPP